MKLLSNDIKNNELMDKKFSYRAENISPHLKWEDIPDKTKSFTMICSDPDAPGGNWTHWTIINIPKNVNEFPQGKTIAGMELENDFGKKGYGGPSIFEISSK